MNLVRESFVRVWRPAISVKLAVSVIFALLLATLPVSANESETTRGSYTGAVETVYPDWFKVSFMELEEDVAEAAAEGKRLMLLFHQNGCPYCNTFIERNLAQKDIEERLKNEFDVIEFNLFGDREVISVDGNVYTEKAFARALEVQFTPTVLFLTEQGQLALRLNGYYDPDQFRLALDYVSGKKESEMSFNEYVASVKQTSSSKKLVERDYFTGPAQQLADRPGKGEKPLLLLFEQGTCSTCEQLHDAVFSRPVTQKLLSEYDVYQVDMWGRETFQTPDGEETTGRALSASLDVNYAPTLILYAADGTEVIRSESYLKSFHTQSLLDYVASDAWREEPNFQRFLSERAEELRDKGTDVNIYD